MIGSRALWFGVGMAAGVIASQALLNPEGRALTKSMIKKGFVLRDWVTTNLDLFREDFSDLVAEAREEHQTRGSAA